MPDYLRPGGRHFPITSAHRDRSSYEATAYRRGLSMRNEEFRSFGKFWFPDRRPLWLKDVNPSIFFGGVARRAAAPRTSVEEKYRRIKRSVLNAVKRCPA